MNGIEMTIDALEIAIIERNEAATMTARNLPDVDSDRITQQFTSDCCGCNNYLR